MYKVYVKTDTNSLIIDVNSSAFLSDLTDWIEINEGDGDKYHHAQNHYFDKPIITEGGAYQYKLVNGAPVECTAEEIAAQEAANIPDPVIPDVEENVWDALDAAYQAGYDEGYAEGVNKAYDE